MRNNLHFLSTLFVIVCCVVQPVFADNNIIWSFIDGSMRTHVGPFTRDGNAYFTYNTAAGKWGDATVKSRWSDGDGEGYTLKGNSTPNSQMAVLHLWECTRRVPAFAVYTISWRYDLGERSPNHQICVRVHVHSDLNELKNTPIRFHNVEKDDQNGVPYKEQSPYLIGKYGYGSDGASFCAYNDYAIRFNNKNGETPQDMKNYLLCSYIVGNGGNSRHSVDNTWGSFRQIGEHPYETIDYYKYITYDTNGGVGWMGTQEVMNYGTLDANSFYRYGYVFQGWNTRADGTGDTYADQASVSAGNGNAGYVHLYAQWAPVPVIENIEFSQLERKVKLMWNTYYDRYVNGKWVIYRDNTLLISLPGTQKYYEDMSFSYESNPQYQIWFVPNGHTDTEKIAGLGSAIRGVNTQRRVNVDNLKTTVRDSCIALTWDTESYPADHQHVFYIYMNETLLDSIPQTNYRWQYRWEHRSVTTHSDRRWGNNGETYWVEEPIDICSPHNYTVKGLIKSKVFNQSTMEKVAIATSTEFVFMEASKTTEDHVNLTWKVNRRGSRVAKKYIIERRLAHQNNGAWTQIAELSEDKDLLNYTDMESIPGKYYEYRVTVVDQCADNREYHNSTTDFGYVLNSGSISGRITYGGTTAVPGVSVEARRSDSQRPFRALQLLRPTARIRWDYPNNQQTGLSPTAYAASIFSTQPFSMQLWLRPESLSDCPIIDLVQWSLGMTSTGQLCIRSGTNQYVFDNVALQAQMYNHITLTRSGNQLTAYVVRTDGLDQPSVLVQTMTLTLPADTASYMTLGGSQGYIDEFRLWTKALSQQEIMENYDLVLTGSESQLETYWPFDEGITEHSFDRTKKLHNCSHIADVRPSELVPNALEYKARTDINGEYQLMGLPLLENEQLYYVVTPSMGLHAFDPVNQTCRVNKNREHVYNIDFEDKSSFQVTGRVVYAGTDYPVAGCTFHIDGSETASSAVTSDEQGEFSINVPIGEHYIEVRKDGHVFSDGGRWPGGTALHTFVNPVHDLTFQDQTLVNLSGRVVGGDVEGNKAIGFGLSRNNIGVATITLVPQTGDYSLNTKSDTVHLNKAHPNLIHSTAWRGAGTEDGRKLFIQTDPATGEFAAMLPPLSYRVADITVASSGLQVLGADNSFIINMTDPTAVHTETTKNTIDTTERAYSCHTLFRHTYHSAPTFTVRQKDHPDGSFGIDSFTVHDIWGTKEVKDIHTVQDGQVQYRFGAPLFVSFDRYQFEMTGYEDYINLDFGDSIRAHVPMVNTMVKIINNLAFKNDSVRELHLDSVGKVVYSWQAGMPLLTHPYTNTLQVQYGEYSSLHDALNLSGIVLGAEPTGNNFVTTGPADLDMILRDPPGSQSFASWTQGSVTTVKTLHSDTRVGDYSLEQTASIRPTAALSWGSGAFSAGGEVSFGATLHGISYADKWSWTSSDTYTKTVTFTQTFSTSASPQFDGPDGDIFIGTSTNIIIGDVRELSLYRKETDTTQVDLNVKNTYAQGVSFPTTFAYTQYEIIHGIIPDLENIRNSILVVVPNKDSVVNNTDKPMYVTQLKRSDPNSEKKVPIACGHPPIPLSKSHAWIPSEASICRLMHGSKHCG